MMSPSDGGWQFTTVYDICWDHDPQCDIGDIGSDVFKDVVIDTAGNIYATEGGGTSNGVGIHYRGNVIKLGAPHEDQYLVGFAGDDFRDLELDASGKVYGTTGACGSNQGTVWQLTPQQ
jgi:hypothetical protein